MIRIPVKIRSRTIISLANDQHDSNPLHPRNAEIAVLATLRCTMLSTPPTTRARNAEIAMRAADDNDVARRYEHTRTAGGSANCEHRPVSFFSSLRCNQ